MTTEEVIAQAGSKKDNDGRTFTDYLNSVGWKPKTFTSWPAYCQALWDTNGDGKKNLGEGKMKRDIANNPEKYRAMYNTDREAFNAEQVEILRQYFAIWSKNLPADDLADREREAFETKSKWSVKKIALFGGMALVVLYIVLKKK